ncbi:MULTISPECIES: DNA-binding domain-containing protein [unclassified Pseudomonas]|nr:MULTISPECIES: DNA-binding domain-containing protein [unclassified Pseudomonas]NWC95851.1 putative DNA-binding domain-containing protein [Pseudomonas sp. IPO3779]NWD20162.1 putative DNA-binding domain-containing protein [Pseudomonas sp. IPO3778]
MNLAQWQQAFHTWLVSASDESARVLGNKTAGLAVYQNNYRAQLVGCLEQAFPHLRRWVGDEAFLAAAIRHIDRHPPHAWTLDAYPEGFHLTLGELFPNNPDVHELAWIESSLNEAFVAADASPLPMEVLEAVDWDTARLQLTPSLRCHGLTTNAEAIWSALWQQTPAPEAVMLAEAGGLLVWRRQFTSRLRQVDALEFQALAHLQGNGSFAGLCEFLVARLGEEEGVAKAGELLAGWIGSELIVGVVEDLSVLHFSEL